MNLHPSIELTSRFRLMMATGLVIFAALLGIVVGMLCWGLRDGLGPGAMESTGVEAVRRFAVDFWPVGTFCLALVTAAFFIAPRSPASPPPRAML